MSAKTIKIKYFKDDAERLEKIQKGDWIDLRADEDMKIFEGESAMIPLGIAMELPVGYEAHLAPRSSTFKKWGLIQTNSIGVIDETYCGDNDQWMMPVFCLKGRHGANLDDAKPYTIVKRGDRVAQFRIMEHQPTVYFEEVEALGNPDRDGFGSTGSN